MSRKRFITKPMPYKKVILFNHAAEVWFWYIRSERARREGMRTFNDQPNETRPCEPDDVYRFVMALRKAQKIRDEHLQVLAKFGWRESPPDPRVPNEERPLILWNEALDRLTTVFVSKGIVDLDDQHYRLKA